MSAIVNNYIKNGEPISSKSLCDFLNLDLSSATIRNEMAELTDMGFLEQPHTSAGRIPSYKGYRFFIDELMVKKKVSQKARDVVNHSFKVSQVKPEILLNEASAALANITHLAVVLTKSSASNAFIKKIHLVKTSKFTAMVVVTLSNGVIKNNIFRYDYILSDEVISVFTRILNNSFCNVQLADININFINNILLELGELAVPIEKILYAVFDIVKEILKVDIHLNGQTNLLFLPEFKSEQALKVIEFLNHTSNIERIISECTKKTNVVVGKENLYDELLESSIIATRYFVNGNEFGSIGVIGPMRLDYGTLIADIEYVASTIGDLLSESLIDDED